MGSFTVEVPRLLRHRARILIHPGGRPEADWQDPWIVTVEVRYGTEPEARARLPGLELALTERYGRGPGNDIGVIVDDDDFYYARARRRIYSGEPSLHGIRLLEAFLFQKAGLEPVQVRPRKCSQCERTDLIEVDRPDGVPDGWITPASCGRHANRECRRCGEPFHSDPEPNVDGTCGQYNCEACGARVLQWFEHNRHRFSEPIFPGRYQADIRTWA
jgi:hypothetical protein